MAKTYKKVLVIFRRDLRLVDHTALLHAATVAEQVIPCFIIDPRQIDEQNEFRSLNAMQFMHTALQDLSRALHEMGGKLYCLQGIAEKVVKQILAAEAINAVFVNRDYTPFSMRRDAAIEHECLARGVDFIADHDLLLHEPDEVLTNNGLPYVVFTPFFKRAFQMPVRNPVALNEVRWYTKPLSVACLTTLEKALPHYENEQIAVVGTRAAAATILKNIHLFADYGRTHDIPSIATTHLSAYLKFGLVSIREVYHAIAERLGTGHPLIRQLFWRDFFTHVAYFSPFVFGAPFKERYRELVWDNDKRLFKLWCAGNTGFPIIDAGMRELNESGYMHNRVRLLTASFLVKDLHVDWRWGERYFATRLVDYDPAVNNGNWQWVASTGTDAQPYFRIFNPWLQQKKFDPDCLYIKKWVPELKNVEPKIIHSWYRQTMTSEIPYPSPCINHASAAAESKKRYRR